MTFLQENSIAIVWNYTSCISGSRLILFSRCRSPGIHGDSQVLIALSELEVSMYSGGFQRVDNDF